MIPITLDKNLPVIIIDTGYFVFYRYFSSIKWYGFQNKNIVYEDIHKNMVFMEAFIRHISADLKKLCKTWKTIYSNMLFCCDCSRESIWRNNYTTTYKSSRITNLKFNTHIFTYFYEYLEKNKDAMGFKLLQLDNLEADDIAYLTKKKLCDTSWDKPIVIITNDNDYLQMLDSNTHIYNMNGKGNDISKRSCGDPIIDLKLKIIMGDKSDNIKAIHTGLNIKKATEIAHLDEDAFEKYLDDNKCKDTYMNNKKLVDLSMIPEEYVELFFNKYEFVYK